TEPDVALTMQQQELLKTEGLEIEFQPESIDAMAELAADANARMENIGARRLITIIECVFEQISFDAPDMAKQGEKNVSISAEFVRERLETILKDEDLSRFVL
ncbi:MAG: HslU--HslV peptidase ATPase subunit, partial [Planctomycetota bacterium]|nr:HslU--HslV peptidase ATPase subunit [Planctomycetota bacterium]